MSNTLDNLSPFNETFAKVHNVMLAHEGENIRIAYSGGADSTVIMWLFRHLGYDIPAVFYNTGLEYKATFEHLDYMREQGFNIETVKPKYPIPYAQRKYGTPFLSKYVSDRLHRLQSHNFKFREDGAKSFEELMILYPGTKSALHWWTDTYQSKRLNIAWNRGLKEFLVYKDGIPFPTSDKCCDITKKNLMFSYAKENDISLVITGIRKAEGGKRSTAFSSCYLPKKYNPYNMYFPLFYWKQADIELFEKELNIKRSKCYTLYGMDRTGCAACPYGKNFEDELTSIEVYEPKLFKLASHVFKNAYETTREYREFVKDGYEPLAEE